MGKCLSRERNESNDRDGGGQDSPMSTKQISMIDRGTQTDTAMGYPEDTSNGGLRKIHREVQTDASLGSSADWVADISNAVDNVDNSIKRNDDVNFVIQGKRISAGRDFLSLHSDYFNVLLNDQKYADHMCDAIHLDKIEFNDFVVMLAYLSEPTRPIQAEAIDSLLILGEFYDIKCLMDRVESFLINALVYSVAQKLLLAERYRLVRLQTWCAAGMNDSVFYVPNQQAKRVVLRSPEFGHLSDTTRDCFLAAAEPPFFPDPDLIYSISPDMPFAVMREVEAYDEPASGFIASGVLGVQLDCGKYDWSSIDMAGLVWSVSERDDDRLREFPWNRKRENGAVAPYLVVNFNQRSTVEWSAEGFVTAQLVVVRERTIEEVFRVEKKFAFSLSNKDRIGRMGEIVNCEEYARFNLHDEYAFLRFRIEITATSGLRKSPMFDFSIPSLLTDAVFVVEERKLHVNKQYLSMISPRFADLFNETNKVQLKDVTYEDFLAFLQWIYPSARRDLIVSKMFRVLRVAQSLGVTIDSSAVKSYLKDSHYDTLIIERLAFHFQFDLDLGPSGLFFRRRDQSYEFQSNAWHSFRASSIFGLMTVGPKDRLYHYIYTHDFDGDRDGDD